MNPSSSPKVVVIGAGFGGLAAAIRLAARGFRVTLVEKRDQAGGRAYVYRDAGFAFDGGPTVVTAPVVLDELFALAGVDMQERIKLVPVDPFYRVNFSDGRDFNYTGDPERMASEIAKFNPADVDGYHRFVAAAEEIFKVGFEDLADVPFLRFTDMVKIVPQMVRLKSHLSVYSLVKRFVKDPAIRTVLSFHPLLVGGNPFSTTSIYALIAFLERKWGVWFALGGTGAIVQALVDLFVQLGGELRTSSEVDQIVVEKSAAGPKVTGVRLKGGATLPAEIVVCNGDAPFVYKNLIDASFRKRNTDRRIDKMAYSMGLVVVYFGTKKTYPEQAHHTILLGPRYEELLDDIFEKKILAEDFSLYLHAPTRTDPTLAPPGCDDLLRALARAAPRRQHRLGGRGAALPRQAPHPPRGPQPPRAARQPRDLAHHQPAPLPRRAQLRARRRVLDPADARPVGVLPVPQPQSGHPQPVLRWGRDPSGRGPARCDRPRRRWSIG